MKSIIRLLKPYNTKEHRTLFLILAVFFIIFLTIALNRYWQYSAWYYDFGIFYTAISSVAQLKEPIIDHLTVTDKHIWADHFHPIIFLISPFVALFKKGEVLLVFQTLFVSLSGVFVYKTSKALQKNQFESFAMLFIYLSFVGLHNALITEFHAITLLPLPLSMFFYGMVKKHKPWYFLGLIFTLLTKESTFIIPAWFSLLLLIKSDKEWKKIGLVSLLTSVGYGIFVLKFVFKHFNSDGYIYLSEVPGIEDYFLPELNALKIKTMFFSLSNYGFFPLLAPETLPPVLFNWWSRFSSVAATRHDLGFHYNAEIAPTLILAANIGWSRVKHIVRLVFPKIEKRLIHKSLYLVVILVAISNITLLKSPILLFGIPDFYKNTGNFEFLDRLIEHIPEDGIIMAQTNIAAKIAHRKVYMLRGNYNDYPQDYIVVDTREGQEPNNFYGVGNDYRDVLKNLASDPNYEVYYDQGEQIIYKRIKY